MKEMKEDNRFEKPNGNTEDFEDPLQDMHRHSKPDYNSKNHNMSSPVISRQRFETRPAASPSQNQFNLENHSNKQETA